MKKFFRLQYDAYFDIYYFAETSEPIEGERTLIGDWRMGARTTDDTYAMIRGVVGNNVDIQITQVPQQT